MTGVAVTGIGLVTPCGVGVDANWARVVAGDPTAATQPELAGLPVDFACTAPADLVRPGARRGERLDRYQVLASVAAHEAVEDAKLDTAEWEGHRVAVVIGTGVGGVSSLGAQYATLAGRGPEAVSPFTLTMTMPNMAAGQVAIELGARGPSLGVSTACASGATAIGLARDLIRSGAADIAIAGGAEAAVTPLHVSAFARMRALSRHPGDPRRASRPFDVARDGFVIAEGAGMFVLESDLHARARGARIRGYLAGYGASTDAHHVSAPDPSGAGAELAMRSALRDADVSVADIGYVNAHGTSTPMNDVIEGDVIGRVLGNDAVVSSTKGVTGHALGAAGAIEVAYALLAVENRLLPPNANLDQPDPRVDLDLVTVARESAIRAAISNSFGFGGQNTALVVTAA